MFPKTWFGDMSTFHVCLMISCTRRMFQEEAKKCEVIKSGYTGPEAYPKKFTTQKEGRTVWN